jgi:phosphoglucosamine mutase
MMVDAAGELYDGDRLIYVIARQMAKRSRNEMGGVVGTLMSNLGFEHALGRLGIPFARAKVGDRYVLELLQEKGWQLGGENSGHVICLDQHSTGDGIVAALQVLAALRASGETLTEACADLSMYPQKLINVRLPAGFDWKADPSILEAAEQAEKLLNGSGRVLLRPSGTEPLLRVMVEGEQASDVLKHAEAIAAAVRSAIDD